MGVRRQDLTVLARLLVAGSVRVAQNACRVVDGDSTKAIHNSRKAPRGHDLGVVRPPESVRSQGPKHLIEGGFFSEDFLLCSTE